MNPMFDTVRRKLFLLPLVLGAMFLLACGQGEVMTPEQINQVEQGLCANDTHCEFYTDGTFTSLCGERDMCINCSAANSSWGCVGSPHRQCWIMAECSSPPPHESDPVAGSDPYDADGDGTAD